MFLTLPCVNSTGFTKFEISISRNHSLSTIVLSNIHMNVCICEYWCNIHQIVHDTNLLVKYLNRWILPAHPGILLFILRAPWWLVSFAFQCILSTLKNPPSWLYHKCIFNRAVHTAKHYQSNIQIRNLSLFELLPMYLFCFFPRPNLEQIITERKLSYIWVNGAAFDDIFSFLDFHLFFI